MSNMTKEEENNLREHIRENFERLSEVVQTENCERQAVKENLEEFHKALNEREKIFDTAADKKRSDDLAELDEQIAQLQKFIAENV